VKENEELRWLRDLARKLGVILTADKMLSNPRLPLWSGSSRKGQHHYGKGGLLSHTTEVVRLCFKMANEFPEHDISHPVLFLAALYHDCGKMWDYEPFDPGDPPFANFRLPVDPYAQEWRGTDHKRLIHHISRSAVEFSIAAKEGGLPDAMAEEALHAILAHHTSRQAGSPVAPRTRIAWLVTLCDNMSARMDDADTWDIVSGRKGEAPAV
jgi:3'-5' exoribonuclease